MQTDSRTRPAPLPVRFAHYLGSRLARLVPVSVAALVGAVLVVAWRNRDEGYITAETGIGYWLGIAGAVSMLVLLLYPLRKRWRVLHGLGRVAGWFRLHMMLGIAGPLLIVLHSNFKLGSLNSSLALATMLAVVASGIVGRYLYGNVHKGLYGSQLRMREIDEDFAALEVHIGRGLAGDPAIMAELESLSRLATHRPSTMAGALWAAGTGGVRIRRARARIRPRLRQAVRAAGQAAGATRRERSARIAAVDHALSIHFAAARKAVRLALFERLLALWHVFHLPLFVMLVLTTVIHIVAVHLY